MRPATARCSGGIVPDFGGASAFSFARGATLEGSVFDDASRSRGTGGGGGARTLRTSDGGGAASVLEASTIGAATGGGGGGTDLARTAAGETVTAGTRGGAATA